MGTSKSGRYLNTQGSGRYVSDFALVHSNEGKFTYRLEKKDGERYRRLILASGGHGQKGMELLDKYHIPYNIVKTYPNGVRIGNIPSHQIKWKRSGSQQSWFPKSWTEKDIRHAGEHVTSLKTNRHKPDGQKLYGTWKGVRVGVIKTSGKIGTIFPDINQPKRRK